MSIPKKVNILGIKYDVFTYKKPFQIDENDPNIRAQISYNDQKIKLLELKKDQMKVNLVHEIVHGILSHSEYHTEAGNEKLVQAITHGLISAFKCEVK